jgi:hypothetical protein
MMNNTETPSPPTDLTTPGGAPEVRRRAYRDAADAVANFALTPDDGTEPESSTLHLMDLLRYFVTDIYIPAIVKDRRASGTTWDAIGRELKLSRQAVQQRYGSQT